MRVRRSPAEVRASLGSDILSLALEGIPESCGGRPAAKTYEQPALALRGEMNRQPTSKR